MTYKSRMMTTLHDGDGSCVVCQFLSGDDSPEIMRLVIQRLDDQLAETEKARITLTELLLTKIDSHGGPGS